MAYSVKSKKSGKTYFLHSRKQELKGGHVQTLYFFAAQAQDGAMDSLPEGYMIHENEKTGLPLLKKG
jgi:YHS domain-containing protein